MSPAAKKGVLIGGALAVVAIVAAAVVVLAGGSPAPAPGRSAQAGPVDPGSAARRYLAAFAAGDADSASALTDAPQAALSAVRDVWSTLKPREVSAKLDKIGTPAGERAAASYTLTWTFGPGRVWSYPGSFDIVRGPDGWRVHWAPSVVHPKLQAGQRLVAATAASDVPAVLDRDGKPVVLSGAGGLHPADDQAFPLLRSALTSHAQSSSGDAFAVERVDSSGKNLETLFGHTGATLKPVTSSVSTAVQTAAQSAVDGYRGKAVLVALQPSSGDVLAVAQNSRVDNAASAFSGQYAPGSTFKIVTATAALEAGLVTVDSPVACPLTDRIGTRTLSNEGFGLGTTTLHRAFARSCNTTFGRLASQLPSDGLVKAAGQYGLNADFDLPGLSTELGRVDPPRSADEQVEDGIGQGTVQVSPFGAAVMAATVASGHAITPRLWADGGTTVTTPYSAPSGSVLAPLRTMMREVVTGGTATGLAHSGTVFGKTGTAQFGDGAEAHGWFVGYRGDVAFSVFLEGANDSGPAVAVGAKFVAELR
ncbi:penicillin-binding transpeptidase domain-containing protein [Amycolatopsis jiangsuensis]|uniref:Beta-lactamase class D n=1 Tax=Amycolatopsis jiangsuensis TaxID=1181879 RepID=A0A840IN64_9PSEU|nr:penicillin-binding transpeptidase domain-containing protein [Amycolatopsis jiangsuensis]MBB4682817.1 beta-lactamase class D [Amycolatopsis jiangsuensis]